MVTSITTDAANVFRDGPPLSPHYPEKQGIRALFADVDSQKRAITDPLNATATSVAALKAIANPTANVGAYLGEQGRAGWFVLRFGNYTARLASDPYGFIYIKHNDISAGTACWVRDRQDMNLNIEWGGAVATDEDDNSAAANNTLVIQGAMNLIEVEGVGGLFIPARTGLNYLHNGLKYSSLTPIKIVGQGSVQGTYVAAGNNGSVLQYVPLNPAAPGDAIIIESSSPLQNYSLSGFEMESVTLYTKKGTDNAKPYQLKASGGVGLVCRAVYGACRISNVTIVGFATGFKTDDNSSAQGGLSTRCGKFVITGLRVSRASYRRADIGAMASAQFFGCPFLEESIDAYECDLRYGSGTNGGRTDDLQFFGCQFIGSGIVSPANYPDYNVLSDGLNSIVNVFYGCAFEQAKIAAVKVTANLDVSYTNLTLIAPWFNGQRGYLVDSLGARTVVSQPGGGSGPAVKIDGTTPFDQTMYRFRGAASGTTTPRIGGGIFGGNVSFYGPGAVEVQNASAVSISNLAGADYSGHGYPVVVLGTYTDQCVASGIMPSMDTAPDTGGVVNSGTNNSTEVMAGVESGAAYGGGPNRGRGAWSAFTPTVTSFGGTIGANSGSVDIMREGNIVRMEIDWSVGAGGTGYVAMTLPVAAVGVAKSGGGKDRNGLQGALTWTIDPAFDPNMIVITRANDTYPAAVGSILSMVVSYRCG